MVALYITLLFLLSTVTVLDAYFRSRITVTQTTLPGHGYHVDSVYTSDCINVRYENVATRIELRQRRPFRIVFFSTPCRANYAHEIRNELLYEPTVVNRKPICSFAIQYSVRGEVEVTFAGNTDRTFVVSDNKMCINIGSHMDPSSCFPNSVSFTSPAYNGVRLFSGSGCNDEIQSVYHQTNLVDMTLDRVKVRAFRVFEVE